MGRAATMKITGRKASRGRKAVAQPKRVVVLPSMWLMPVAARFFATPGAGRLRIAFHKSRRSLTELAAEDPRCDDEEDRGR
jgi:hypothetical protein